MRITLAVRYFRSVGGMEKFTLNLARFLVRQGHQVRVYAFKTEPLPGIEFHRLPWPWWALRFMRDWDMAYTLARAVEKDRETDLVYGEQKMWGCDILRPAGGVEDDYWKAHVRYAHRGRNWPEAMRYTVPKRWFDVDAERRGFVDRRLRKVIVNSAMIRDQLLACYPGLGGRIEVIHEGIDIDPAAAQWSSGRGEFLSQFGLAPDALTALFIGHEFARKGLRHAIHAVARARALAPSIPLQLLVVGRDNPKEYRALARRLGIGKEVVFAGTIVPPGPCFGAADMLLFPSAYDPFANVTLEALAAGVPVLTTRQNGGAEVIAEGVNGWVVESPGRIEAMARILLGLQNRVQMGMMRRACINTARHHSLESKLKQVEQIFIEVVDNRLRTEARTSGIDRERYGNIYHK